MMNMMQIGTGDKNSSHVTFFFIVHGAESARYSLMENTGAKNAVLGATTDCDY